MIRFLLLICLCILAVLLFAGCGKRTKEKPLPLGTIGVEEPIFIDPFPKPFAAKVDTGADIASIDAEDIREIVRNDKKYVSFLIRRRGTDEVNRYELPLVRIMPITRHGQKPLKRYVVMLKIRLGAIPMRKEFSLANRSNFTYQVLLGKNVLAGNAAVDVMKKNTLQ